ncbi:type VI secretion system PAAR protein [Aeromonas salmonicida]|nr:type VI secretion system PAAR protein [Aeromonas salmonicida]MDF8330901.1 type VI secretion system PAAR protein [Aeromonas salmonicida]
MSKHAAKVGNIGTDHEGFYPTPITAGSPDVFIDGIPAARVGDPLAPHDKPNHPPHPRKIASGSSTVLVNGKPLAITGGAVDCGGVIIGSGTVIVGDIAPPFVPPLDIKGLFDEGFVIRNEVTGEPLSNVEYRIIRANGNVEYGKTDETGHTHIVSAFEEETISIEVKES